MILAIDQGTTGTTCLVFDAEGRIAGRAYSEFEQYFPRPGWVEHDAAEIWEVTRRVAARGARRRRRRGRRARRRSGSPTSARPSSPGTRRRGEPMHRALVWQDRRTAERCEELRAAGLEPLVRERTGLDRRPLLLGDQDRVAAAQRRGDRAGGLRHDRLLAAVQADRPPRHRLPQRLADDAVRHPPARLGPGALRGARRRPGAAARAAALGRRLRHHLGVRRRGAGGGHRRRPAGGAVRPGLPLAPGTAKNTYGTGSFVLLNCGAEAPPSPPRACSPPSPGGSASEVDLRARGRDLRHRRRRAVAARRARGDRRRRPRPSRSPPRSTPTTASTSCRR